MRPTSHTRSRPCIVHEHGFSLVEIIVVLIIIAFIMAIGVWSVQNAHRSGDRATAVAVAHHYATAVDQFARDHDGRFPGAPGSTDWPTDAKLGPESKLLGTKKSYLRSIPEAVQDGIVDLQSGDGPAVVSYALAGTGYEFTVEIDRRPTCSIVGGGATSALPACSNR